MGMSTSYTGETMIAIMTRGNQPQTSTMKPPSPPIGTAATNPLSPCRQLRGSDVVPHLWRSTTLHAPPCDAPSHYIVTLLRNTRDVCLFLALCATTSFSYPLSVSLLI